MSILVIHPEVEKALKNKQPVVALESTIISHGMPYPKNIETSQAVEQIIRQEGAVPATIAVIRGRIHVGLDPDHLELLGKKQKDLPILKLSRRDLAYAISTESTGATTVAATMICAEMAGIDVFATGGIGGVHRGGENSFDISADLYELSRTPVAVVCAGAKSILDIGRTLEVLETLGVPVIGYQTSQFPAFFSRTSEFPVDYRFDQVPQMARLIRCQKELGLKGGVLIANPVPIESEIPAQEIEKQIEEALREADRKGIHGKEVTPFLLSAVVEKTQGRSLKTNIALIQNNARLAAKLAREMRI